MNKRQYLQWIATRGPIGEWKHSDCVEADNLIRDVALRNFGKLLRKEVTSPVLKELFFLLVAAHYGTVEVDDAFIALKLYPEWAK